MLCGLVHREDLFALFRATERTILFLPAGSTRPDPDDVEKELFDSDKFGRYDERLAVLTYKDSGNSSVSLSRSGQVQIESDLWQLWI